ncbi:MAG: hypothetical protein P4M11_03285 [Candidatus Pacebacteria bacterium]|nr:hypothetical protein [Candidatus Paceibacterota bacterium]
MYSTEKDTSDWARIWNFSLPDSVDTVYRYYPEGSDKTYRKSGGVVMYASYNATMAESVFDNLKVAIGVTLNYAVLEVVTYAPNIGVFVWTYVRLDYSPNGRAEVKVSNTAFRIHQYAGNMKYRAILEILTCLFLLYFVYYEIYEWVMVWEAVRAKDNESCLKPNETDGTGNRIMIFLYLDPRKDGNSGGVPFSPQDVL